MTFLESRTSCCMFRLSIKNQLKSVICSKVECFFDSLKITISEVGLIHSGVELLDALFDSLQRTVSK